jgi:hypothetical protein
MIEEPKPRVKPEPNPITRAAHRRQITWQIWVPFGAVLALILLAAVAVVVAGLQGTGDVGLWAEISLIWLIVPMLFLTVIAIAITAGVAVLITMAVQKLPPYSRQLQDIFAKISFYTRKYSDAAVEPFLRAHSASASIRALGRKNPNKS